MPAPLHIFRAGTYTDMHGREITISPEELAAAAAAYDPALHQAPIVVGHPKDNSPAFGWLASLSATGADLEGEPIEVDPAFAEAVRAGRYKTRSASFWQPEHPGNPKPGVWYLRHLGFLGGAAPAVKGLRGADLADGASETVVIEFSEVAVGLKPDLQEAAMPEQTTETLDLAEREAALSAREAELAAQAEALAEREQALAQAEADRRRAEVTAFAEGLAEQARIRPADVPRLTEIILALALHAPEPAAAFAAGEGAEPVDAATWLRGYLAASPPLVELSEVASRERLGDILSPAPQSDEYFKVEYQRDPKLQAEFSSPETYLAFRRAQAAGRVSLTNRLTPVE